GLAKCAPAAAETKPGLIPQKTTRRPVARTSGTALAGEGTTSCGDFGLARVEPELEEAAELFTRDPEPRARAGALGLELDEPHHLVVIPVAAEVALLLAQRPQPSHDRSLRPPPDSRNHSYCRASS